MKKIESFQVNHLTLMPGVYVSREDEISALDAFQEIGEPVISHEHLDASRVYPVTTYDIRITRPNFEQVMGTGEIHAIEHIGATYLRNQPELKYRVIYWGPMGCRTGFYLILAGAVPVSTVRALMIDVFRYIAAFEGDIPGATPEECGNYSDMDLESAKLRAERYLRVLEEERE